MILTDVSECLYPSMHLCTYTKLCIDARLKCNGDENCGLHDDTDEAHCMFAIFLKIKSLIKLIFSYDTDIIVSVTKNCSLHNDTNEAHLCLPV